MKEASDIYANSQSRIQFHQTHKIQVKFKTLAKPAIMFNRWNQNKMETFDIQTATALVQIYDGNTDGLENGLDSSNLLKELCPKNPQTLVKFLKTRLKGKARLGLSSNIDDFDSLINDIRLRFQEKLNPDKINSGQFASVSDASEKVLKTKGISSVHKY